MRTPGKRKFKEPMGDQYRILIATGGTGGHIYPAIALAHQYENDGHQVIIVGTGNETEKKIFASEDLTVRIFHQNLKIIQLIKNSYTAFGWVKKLRIL